MLARRGLLEDAFRIRRNARSRRDHFLAEVRSVGVRRRTPIDASVHRWVDHDADRVLCRIERHATADSAMADNLRLVVDLLRAAGIEHFFVPITRVGRSRVGVPIEHRSEVWSAFLAADLPPETMLTDAEAPARRSDPAGGAEFSRVGERVADSDTWLAWRPVTDPAGSIVLGEGYACEIEFWSGTRPSEGESDDGDVGTRSTSSYLYGPHNNAVAAKVHRGALSGATVNVAGRVIPTPVEFARAQVASSTWFPIDVVYTWVDNTDPAWVERFEAANAETGTLARDAAAPHRYANRDELRYSLRSLHHFVDFIRHIYLVTDSQVPSWLDTTVPGLTVIDHRELFDEEDRIPTFNSHAIESKLHHIPGLSERYLYVNDDVFFGRRISPSDYFHSSGLTKFFLSCSPDPRGVECGR